MSGFTAHHKRIVPTIFCFSLLVVFGSLVFFLTPSTADAIAEQNAILLTISKAQQVYYIAEPDIAINIIINDIVIPPYTWSWSTNSFEATMTSVMGRAEDLDWGWRLLPPPQSIWIPSPGMDLISTGVLTGPSGYVLRPNMPPEMRSGTFIASWQMGPLETKPFTYAADDAAYLADDPPVSMEKHLYVVLPNRSTAQWNGTIWSGFPFTPPRRGDRFDHTISHSTPSIPVSLLGSSYNKYVVQEGGWELISVHGGISAEEMQECFNEYKDSWDSEVEINYQGQFVSPDSHLFNRIGLSSKYPSFLNGGVFVLEQWWKVTTPNESSYLWKHYIEFHLLHPPSQNVYVFKTHSYDHSVFLGSESHDRTACLCWQQ